MRKPYSQTRSDLAKLNNEWELRISRIVSLDGLGIEQESPQIEKVACSTIDQWGDVLGLPSVSVMETKR